MKYVMFKRKLGNKEDSLTQYIPIIFPDTIAHSEIVGLFRQYEPHSAGFVSVTCGVFGSSETTGLKHDPVDAQRINMADYGGLIE